MDWEGLKGIERDFKGFERSLGIFKDLEGFEGILSDFDGF